MTGRFTFSVFSVLLMKMALLQLVIEGKQISSTITRESKNLFMVPQYLSPMRDFSLPVDFDDGPFVLQPLPIPQTSLYRTNRPNYHSSTSYSAPAGEGRTFAAFANLFRFPPRPSSQPQCLTPLPSSTISFSSVCPDPVTLVSCAKLTAAPSGVISVKFSQAGTAAVIGIAANSPNTKVQLTCSTIPKTSNVMTKIGDNTITADTTLLGDPNAYISVIGAGVGDELNCVWNTISA